MKPGSTIPALLSFALAACHSSSDSGPSPAPTPLVTNLGLAAERLFGSNELRFVTASEPGQGSDLDGDGDMEDPVLQLLELESGSLVNTGLAVPSSLQRGEIPPPQIGCGDALGVFLVDEPATGYDADGDGDAQEFSTWTFDRRTGRLASLAFGYDELAFDGDLALLIGHEEAHVVLRVLDARDGSVTRLPEPFDPLFVQGDIVAFLQAETAGVDLNFDGDSEDNTVLQLYDAGTRRQINTGWALGGDVRRLGDFVPFLVSERLQGGRDLNGDGDAEDLVLLAEDVHTGLLRDPGVSTAAFVEDPRGAAEDLLLLVSESDGGDRNGDGDALDPVVVLYDPRTERVLDTGLASRGSPLGAGRWIGVSVWEAAQGFADLDGDGRSDSDVLHVFDARTGAIQNLGFQGVWLGALDGHLLAARDERDGDWSGDGDRDDFVLFDWSARTGVARNTGVVVGSLFGTAGEVALLMQPEISRGADLNGDGDQDDLVLGLYDGRTGSLRNLGLATLSSDCRLGPDGRGALLVSEAAQGADLNGDGDLLDQVLHTLDLGR